MKFNKIFTAFLAGALALACCKPAFEYEPASAPQGEQVFFPIEAATQVDLKPGQTSFELPIARATKSLEEIEIAIEASGEKVEFFSVPGAVTFAEDETETVLVVTIAQPDSLVVDVYYDLNIKVSDESLTTPYSRSSIALKVGIAMPWIELGKGTLYEIPYWGETEPNKVIKYQQISDHMRLCKVEGCFGYDTIKNGGSYDVQDYVWYWDTETNDCFIFPFWMGYDNSNGHTMVSDYASYAFIKNDFESQAGFALGSDKYFAWAPGWARSNGLHVPHYDPVQGIFHLADVYSAWTSFEYSKDSILGYYTDSEKGWDQFWLDGFVHSNYDLEVEYAGMLVDALSNAQMILDFTVAENTSIESIKFQIASQDVKAEEILANIVAGEGEVLSLDVTDVVNKAYISDIEAGLYRVVAVPVAEGELVVDAAVAVDIYYPGMNTEPRPVEIAFAQGFKPSELYGPVAAQHGYMDYNSVSYLVQSKNGDIKSVDYYFNKKSVIEEAWGGTLEELVEEYGSSLDADDLADMNDTSAEGGCALLFGSNLLANTEYEVILVIKNNFGESLTITIDQTTDAAPYAGELVIGDYTWTNSNGTPDPITITNIPGDDNAFVVWNIGIVNEAGWHATYDSAKNELVVTGIEYGYESDGNAWGKAYGWFNQTKGWVYAYGCFDTPEGKGTDNLRFAVDPTTHEVKSQLSTQFQVVVVDNSTGTSVGAYSIYKAGAAVTYVPSTTTSVKSVKSASPYLFSRINRTSAKAQAFEAPVKVTKPAVAAEPKVVKNGWSKPCKVKNINKLELQSARF